MTILAENRKQELFWGLNIAAALFLFFIISVFVNSDELMTDAVYRLFGHGRGSLFTHGGFREKLFTGFCLYGRIGLMGYTLVFALAYCMKGSFRSLKHAFSAAILLEVLSELIPLVLLHALWLDGTAVLVLTASDLIAMLLILAHEGDIL